MKNLYLLYTDKPSRLFYLGSNLHLEQGQDNVEYSEMYGFDSKLTEQEWFQQFKKK